MSVHPLVTRDSNVLTISTLSNPFVVSGLTRAIYEGQKRGFGDFLLSFPNAGAVYPNVCTPISGLIDFYRTQGYDLTTDFIPEFLRTFSIFEPLRVDNDRQRLSQRPLNAVWAYSSADEVNDLVDAFLKEVYRSAVCESGVIQGLEWCLNEVLDNVLQHAEASSGFVMGQIHQNSKHIALCIFDSGKGIFNSLRDSPHAPRTHLDAITLAIKEGVTRDRAVGQGNGMWGLYNIVKANAGQLGITSGSSTFRAKHLDEAPFISENLVYPSKYNLCTTVDFQLDFEKPIAVSKALGGHEPINLALEEMEDETGRIIFSMNQKSSGTGTRRSGLAIRTEILNLSKQSNRVVVLDFENVAVVSSSFADELIGKLVAEIGFTSFNQSFRLRNLNNFVQSITNRAVAQRLGFIAMDSTSDILEDEVDAPTD